jgi:PAS domain S-box-containing protein
MKRCVAERTKKLVRANQLLSVNEKALADFFTEAPMGLLLADAEGLIVRANHALAAMLGVPAVELCGRRLAEFFTERFAFIEAMARLCINEPVSDYLVRLRRRDGRMLDTLINAKAVRERGRLVCSRWFVRDVTRLLELQKEILAVGERVQQRIGQELHDDICQQLASIEFLCRALQRQLTANAPDAADRATEIGGLLRKTITHVRELSHMMVPMEVETQDLDESLRTLAASIRKSHGIECRFHGAPAPRVSGGTARVYLYRIAQEAIQNAIKHGRARRIRITLSAENRCILLTVTNNGRSLAATMHKKQRFGLRIMEYRARALRGSLALRNRKGGGTILSCSIPLAD